MGASGRRRSSDGKSGGRVEEEQTRGRASAEGIHGEGCIARELFALRRRA